MTKINFRRTVGRLVFFSLKVVFLIIFLVSQLFMPELLQNSNHNGSLISTAKAAPDPWYGSNWAYRKALVIDHNKVSNTTQNNFPVLISVSNNDFKTVANGGKIVNTNGYDIIFTSQDGSIKLDYEIESYDGVGGSMVVWVKVPALSALVNTIIYVYYSNPNIISSQENKTGVWNDGGSNNFKGVWHMNQDPSGTAPQIKDSTQYANNGTSIGSMVSGQSATGQTGKAVGFDGSNDYIDSGNSGSLSTMDNITQEAWINTSSAIVYPMGNPTYSEGGNRPANESEINSGNTITYNDDYGSLNISDGWVAYDIWAQWVWDFGSLADRNFYIKWNAVNATNTTYSPNVTYTIEASADNVTWTTVKAINYTTNVTSPVYEDGIQGNYRYIRAKIYSNAASITAACYLNVYGVWAGPSSVNKESSYGIGANTSEIFGRINNSFVATSANAGWSHVVLTYAKDGGANNQNLYINGILKSSATLTGTINTGASNLRIGDNSFVGQIDEVRISNIARSADWIKTEYNNQSSPSTFISLQDEVVNQMDHFTLTGNGAQTAGNMQAVTLTAVDTAGNTFGNYTGDKNITLVGANPIGSNISKFTDKNGNEIPFGSSGVVNFVAGVAHTNIKLFKAEDVEIEASDGIYSSNVNSLYDLNVTVSPNIFSKFDISCQGTVIIGIPFPLTLTSQDAYGNTTKSISGSTIVSVNPGTVNLSSVASTEFTDDGTYTGSIAIQNVLNNQSVVLATNHTSVVNNKTLLAVDKGTGNNYYVDPSGNDTNLGTSPSASWATLQHAADMAQAGDTVYVSGTYNLTSIITIAHSGNSTNGWIKFVGGGTATILGDGDLTIKSDGYLTRKPTVSAFSISANASYIQFDGFNIYNVVSAFGAGTRSHHLTFKNNHIKHSYGTGIGSWNMGHDIVIDNNIIEGINASVSDTDRNKSTRAILSFGYPYEGPGFIENVTIANNTISGGTHNCIDIHTRNRNVLIENNDISRCDGSAGIMLHNFGVDTVNIKNNKISNTTYGLLITGSKNLTIEGNIISNFAGDKAGILFMDENITGTDWGNNNGLTQCAEVDNVLIKNNNITNTAAWANSIRFYNLCTQSDPDPAFSDFTIDGNNFVDNNMDHGFDIRSLQVVTRAQFVNSKDSVSGHIYYSGYNNPSSTGSYIDSVVKYTDNSIVKAIVGNFPYLYYPTYAQAQIPETIGWGANTQVYPMTATPADGYLSITVNTINKATDTWNVTVTSSVQENPTTFTMETVHPNTIYSVKRDGTEIGTAYTDNTGKLIYTYQTEGNEYDTSHTFIFVSTGNSAPSAYLLSVTGGTGSGYYTSGHSVTITAGTPPTGKAFDKWTGDVGYISDASSPVASFAMPSRAVVLNANFKDSSATAPTPALTYLSVSPLSLSVAKNVTQQFTATTLDQFNNPIASQIVWSSSNPTVATINSAGMATALSEGTTTITASSGSISTISYLTVTGSTSGGGGSNSGEGGTSGGNSGGGSEGTGGSSSSYPYVVKTEIKSIQDNTLTLSLNVNNAASMMLSDSKDFIDSIWEKYSVTKTYTKKDGQQKLYLKFKSSAGETSSAVELSIPASTSSSAYLDGTLLKIASSFRVYVIINGKKKWIPTPEVFEQLGYKWTSIKIITDTELKVIPDYEDNLIRQIGDYKVYLVVNGVKRHIPNPVIFLDYGFKWEDVKDVDKSIVDKYSDTYLLKESGKEGVYYVRNDGVRKLIPTTEIFNSYGDKNEDIQVVSKMEMEIYLLSNLIRLGNSNDVYIIDGNVKKRIPTVQVFNKYHFNWKQVIGVNMYEFNWYKDGGVLR